MTTEDTEVTEKGTSIVEINDVTGAVVDAAIKVHYLKLGRFRAGLLINFHAARLKDGIKRMINWSSGHGGSP